MAFEVTDWTINRTTGAIRYVGDDHGGASPSYATVIEFHRALQDFADDASSAGDDELDITDINPSNRSTDNIITLLGNYNIDANASEHLFDGSIIQNAGADIYDGIVNFGNSDVQIQIIQDGAVLADDWWNFGGGGLNGNIAAGISHRFMLPVRVAAADVDRRRLLGISRRFGFTYSEFPINGTARGNNVLALSDATDLNNETAEATVATWTTITNVTEGYVGLDVNNDGTPEFYYSEWDKGAFEVNDFFERMKWLTRDGSTSTLYGLNGELFRGITHEIAVDTASVTAFSAFEPVDWVTGTGQMLAIDDVDSPTTMWIQLLTGSTPVDGDIITGGTSAATCVVNVSVIDRSSLISTPFVGASTGSALIGSYGLGLEVTDLTAADKVFDLTNVQITPPNLVTFNVNGLVSGEDRVLVGPWDGVAADAEGNPEIDLNQLTLSTALTVDNVTAVVVTTAIPADTPAVGFIRVQDDAGFYRRLQYSSWSSSTFTIITTDGQEDFAAVNATATNVWIAYIDVLASGPSASFTSVYQANRDLIVKVRDGGGTPIKEFISSAVLGSSGGSITAIRTADA